MSKPECGSVDRFSAFREECKLAPRLNELANFFALTASGEAGAPDLSNVEIDPSLLGFDYRLTQFADVHRSLMGRFDRHFFGSIPFRLEEECRMGEALVRYALAKSKEHPPFKLHSLGSAEGTMARTIAQLCNSSVIALCSSPTRENEQSFYKFGVPQNAWFFHGPFFHLDQQFIQKTDKLSKFYGGFDLIFEDTTFQMYGPDRSTQIDFILQNLQTDGVVIFSEKFFHDDPEEYRRREQQKDQTFKSRFFSSAEIHQKSRDVLALMERGQVTLEQMRTAVSQHLKYSYITWNSGNFYTIVSGNNERNVIDLVEHMTPPCIPAEYSYLPTPHVLGDPRMAQCPRYRAIARGA